MKALLSIALLLVLAACSTPRPLMTEEAVEDFIQANELETEMRIPTRNHDSWRALNDRFIVYKGRRGYYLLDFKRRCPVLLESTVEPSLTTVDRRSGLGSLSAGADTIRGCRIRTIYGITEEQYHEAQNLGDAPGS